MASNEPLYNKVQETGKLLMQCSDEGAKAKIQADLDRVQQHWFQIVGQLEGRREQLDGVLREWNDMEFAMEEVLLWLKDIRQAMVYDLPDNYDELQRELQQCRVSTSVN